MMSFVAGTSPMFAQNHVITWYSWWYFLYYISIYLYIYLSIYLSIYIYVYLCIYIYICVYIYIYMCIYIIYVYICIYIYVYIYVHMYIYIYIPIITYTFSTRPSCFCHKCCLHRLIEVVSLGALNYLRLLTIITPPRISWKTPQPRYRRGLACRYRRADMLDWAAPPAGSPGWWTRSAGKWWSPQDRQKKFGG